MASFTRLLSCYRNGPAGNNAAFRIGTQHLTYFDDLPMSTLSVVIQHLAINPYCDRWLENIDANDALTVLKSGGPLSTAARKSFTSLCQSDFQKCNSLHIKLVNVMAPHLEHLYLWPVPSRKLRLGRFRALRELVISNFACEKAIQRILATCGTSLRELRFDYSFTEKTSLAISRYCGSLHVLDLGYGRYQGTLEHVFLTIGSTLRQLSGLLLEEDFVHVMRHCSRLEKLNLMNLTVVWFPTAIDLLKSLNTLRVLNISFGINRAPSFTVDDLHALISVSPSDLNIHADMGIADSDEFIDYMRVIGTRLHVLSLSCQYFALRNDMFHQLLNLKELSLNRDFFVARRDYTPVLESIFSVPMPNLNKLSIYCFPGPMILPIIARSVSSLRVFKCNLISHAAFSEVPIQGSDFGAVLQANPHLQQLMIRSYLYHDGEYEMMYHLVDVIQNLRFGFSLKEVELFFVDDFNIFSPASRERIRDACVPLRTRRMNLVFCEQPLFSTEECV